MFGFLSGVTKKIGFAAGVLILAQRQAALVAKQAACLDELSEGRFRLGVGVGWNEIEFQGLDVDFHTRGKRSEEQVRFMQALWAEPDEERAPGFSAMARVTGFPAAIAARLLARGLIQGGPGIVAPEDGVSGAALPVLVSELARRGLTVRETVRAAGV